MSGFTEIRFLNLIKKSFHTFEDNLIADFIVSLNNKDFSQVKIQTSIGEFERVRPNMVFIHTPHDEYKTEYVLKSKTPPRKICIKFDNYFMYMFDNDTFRYSSSIEDYCERYNQSYKAKITPFSILAETINHEWFYRSILWNCKADIGQLCGYPEKKWGRAFFTKHCDNVLRDEYLIPFINAINKAWPGLKKHVTSHFMSELDKFVNANFITRDMNWETRVNQKLFDFESKSHEYRIKLSRKRK